MSTSTRSTSSTARRHTGGGQQQLSIFNTTAAGGGQSQAQKVEHVGVTERQVRQAFADLAVAASTSFDAAMACPPLAICLRNLAEARERRRQRRQGRAAR